MKRLVAILLTLVCLMSFVGCTDKKVKSPSSDNSGGKTDSTVVGSLIGGIGANAEYISSDEGKVEGQLSGSQTVTSGNVAENTNEIIPTWKDAYKLRSISGGADAQAAASRNKILNAKDSVKVTGTKYYVSSLNGNDDNDGRSPAKALKTLPATANLSLKEGDAVLLERGSVFRLTGSFGLKSGVTYAAYGSGNKPAVYGSSMNYSVASFWQPFEQMKNVWVLSRAFSGDVGNVVFNHGELASNKIDYIYNMSKNGDFYYDSTACKLYLYLDKGNPAKVYADIEISPRYTLFSLPGGGHDITIDNITLKYSGNFAIRGSELDKITVTNCEIAWIGGAYMPNGIDVYGNGIETAAISNSVFKNNWIYQIFDTGITFQLSEGDVTDVTYSDNLLEYCGMSGFEWWCSQYIGVIENAVRNVLFDNNIVRFTGYGWVYGTSRGARHVQGPFQTQDYPNLKNFVFSNNIFDCAQGGIHYYKWYTDKKSIDRPVWKNNTYYQKKTDSGVGSIYGYGEDADSITHYVNNQKSLDEAVKAFETSPKHVEWLG